MKAIIRKNDILYKFIPILILQLLLSCSQATTFSEKSPKDADLTEQKNKTVSTNSSELEEESLLIEAYQAASQSFSLINKITSLDFLQPTDKKYSENFIQGKEGSEYIQKFSLTEPSKLDLLFMVDDSSSMNTYKNVISDRLEKVLIHISNTNWRIGVITSTESCLNTSPFIQNRYEATANTKYYIDKEMYEANPTSTKAIFKELILQAGIRTSPNEQGIKTIVEAITGSNKSCLDDKGQLSNFWMREGASKSVIIVSDEKNCGSDNGDSCYRLNNGVEEKENNLPWADSSYFFDNEIIKQFNITVHGLLLNSPLTLAEEANSHDCSGSKGAYQAPSEYQNLITSGTNTGHLADICKDLSDYDGILSQISSKMSEQIIKAYTVTNVPVADSGKIKIFINDQPFNGFRVTGRSIYFTDEVKQLSGEVKIQYIGLPEEQFKDFKLKTALYVVENTINISVNGTQLNESEFSYDDSTKTINFQTFPPHSSTIEVEYVDEDYHTSFIYEGDMIESTLTLKINDQLKDSFEIKEGMIVFKKAPDPAAQISLKYNKVGEKKALYASDITFQEHIKFVLEDVVTKEKIEASYSESGIEIKENDLIHDRKVQAFFDDTLDENNELTISSYFSKTPYSTDTITVDTKNLPTECLAGLKIEEDKVQFKCNNNLLGEKIEIPFSYATSYKNSFDVSSTSKIVDEYTRFIVKVNDQELAIEDYFLSNKKIVINKDKLPLKATVWIKAIN